MKDFTRSFFKRFKAARRHGDRAKIAEAVGLSPNNVSRWGTEVDGHWRVPSVYEAFRAAEVLGVSPAWLAFGLEPREAGLLRAAQELGVKLEKDPALRKMLGDFEALDAEHRETVLRMAEQLRATLPVGTQIRRDAATGAKLYDPPPGPPAQTKDGASRASEPLPPGFGPVEARPRRANRRNELATYHITRRPGKAQGLKIPRWLDLAAGPGCELQRCSDYLYFRELPDWKTVHSATIRGDSMMDTLRPGDVVVLKAFDPPPTLEILEDGAFKAPLNLVRAEVPHDSIAVLSLNDDAPTLKRVRYQQSRDGDWILQIVADNPDTEGFPYAVRRRDTVVFYAILKGLAASK